ncbi:GtrA family protein [Klebsiella aerogenes]
MLNLFARYFSVGILNTLIHWVVFYLLIIPGTTQAIANLLAFCVAVTFSFFVNAAWTFKARATSLRYLLYVVFMGAVAMLTGMTADSLQIPPLATLVIFSAISLVCGFLYSKFVVFRELK